MASPLLAVMVTSVTALPAPGGQKFRVPSPLRPQTTMAIEKVKVAARAAHPTVISRVVRQSDLATLPVLRTDRGEAAGQAVMERQRLQQPYPTARVIVLDDDHNTFQHVVEVLVRYIPGMTPDRAWEHAHQIDGQGSAVVWSGPLEQAELYHQQLGAEGLTMAPLEIS